MGTSKKTSSGASMERIYHTQGNAEPKKGQFFKMPSKTDQTGVLPSRLQIQRLIDAGQRLDDYRKFVYDFKEIDKIPMSDVEMWMDPTRDKDFDLADVTRIRQEIAIRKNEQEYYKLKKDAEDLDKTAQEEVEKDEAVNDTDANESAQKNDK